MPCRPGVVVKPTAPRQGQWKTEQRPGEGPKIWKRIFWRSRFSVVGCFPLIFLWFYSLFWSKWVPVTLPCQKPKQRTEEKTRKRRKMLNRIFGEVGFPCFVVFPGFPFAFAACSGLAACPPVSPVKNKSEGERKTGGRRES